MSWFNPDIFSLVWDTIFRAIWLTYTIVVHSLIKCLIGFWLYNTPLCFLRENSLSISMHEIYIKYMLGMTGMAWVSYPYQSVITKLHDSGSLDVWSMYIRKLVPLGISPLWISRLKVRLFCTMPCSFQLERIGVHMHLCLSLVFQCFTKSPWQ